jgi:hypothetical protein
MDRVVHLALRQYAQAHETLRQTLHDMPRDDGEFPAALAAVRDTGLVTIVELADWVGLSRSRVYELLAEHDEQHE